MPSMQSYSIRPLAAMYKNSAVVTGSSLAYLIVMEIISGSSPPTGAGIALPVCAGGSLTPGRSFLSPLGNIPA